jgi:hypothetical protein
MNPTHAVAFLTGQSDPGRCALSPEQEAFLAQLARADRHLVPLNFPYRPSPPFRDVNLLSASWHNLRGYFASRRPEFAAAYRAGVADLIRQTERTFFLAGSSGLELFNNLHLSAADEARCTLICYGPVARRLPRHATVVLVQSSRDYLSRAYFPHAPRTLGWGHMGYLRDPEFLRLCRDHLALHAPTPCSSTFA